jgi:GNAT superfamily N-acetyltransferase
MMTFAEIRQVDTLTPRELQELHGWGEDIFGMATYGLTFRAESTHLVLYTDAGIASHAGLVKDEVRVSGVSIPVAGVCGVVTVPHEQGRGHARRLLEHAVSIMRGWSVDGGLLFCIPRMVPYYEKLAWKRVSAPVTMEQSSGTVLSPIPVMVLPFSDRLVTTAPIELHGLPW